MQSERMFTALQPKILLHRHHSMLPELFSMSLGLRSLQTGDYKVVSSSEIRQKHHNIHITSKSKKKEVKGKKNHRGYYDNMAL